MKLPGRYIAMLALMFCGASTLSSCTNADSQGDFSLVKAGDHLPVFTIDATTEGISFDSRNALGSKLFIYFFASYCGDCHKATPSVIELSKLVGDNVTMLCIARGSNATLEQSTQYWSEVAQNTATATQDMPPLYYDTDRMVYNKFASHNVPRYYVVDSEGKIAWQSEGQFSAEALLQQIQSAK